LSSTSLAFPRRPQRMLPCRRRRFGVSAVGLLKGGFVSFLSFSLPLPSEALPNLGKFLKVSSISSTQIRESPLTFFALFAQLTLAVPLRSNSTLFTSTITSTSPMIPYLPTELLRTILSNVSTRSDLARCCSTSKTFLYISQPLLYYEVEFKISVDSAEYYPGIFVTHLHYSKRSYTMLETLKRYPRLQSLVRTIKLRVVDGRHMDSNECQDRRINLEELIEEMIATFPKTQLLTLCLSDYDDLDEAVYKSQVRQVNGPQSSVPAFSIVILGGLGHRASLRGAYERFQWLPISVVGEHVEMDVLLKSSQDTLRNLAIPLTGSTSLSFFSRLERLSLRLSVQTPSNTIHNISGALVGLTSLRVLKLHGSARQEDLEVLLHSAIFALALPSSFTHLYISFAFTSADVLAFLRVLPRTSNLKSFNCWSEMGEIEEVKEEFSKRGIRLSLNDEWVI